MEECRTPTNKSKFNFNLTPTMRWNHLNVNTSNVRCSTPITGAFRSPNMSPIQSMRALKSPAKTMLAKTFKKPPLKKYMHHMHRTEIAAPVVVLSKRKEDGTEREQKSNSSSDNLSDDSNVETSLCRESRRRSIMASNHSYVFNHGANVEQVLVHVGLAQYVDNFEKAHIDLVDLASMERDDLKNIGLSTDEDCNRILDVLKEL
ncbi:protein matrimony [Drosophila subobscura]|uniref:protein matrimony n=1 Tax=Drosophila subobscura TaxID=7241 RepID=UPI00155A2DEF|nr:protein matrimony [Drosophila subobscura]